MIRSVRMRTGAATLSGAEVSLSDSCAAALKFPLHFLLLFVVLHRGFEIAAAEREGAGSRLGGGGGGFLVQGDGQV